MMPFCPGVIIWLKNEYTTKYFPDRIIKQIMPSKYHLSVDIVMVVMSTMLVIGSSLNQRMGHKSGSVKLENGKAKKTGKLLGMDVNGAKKFAQAMAIFASGSAGIFMISALSGKCRSKPGDVVVSISGFAVALGLILSGVMAIGIHEQLVIPDEKDKKNAKMSKDASIAFMVLGSVALVLSVLKVSMKRAAVGAVGMPRFAGGGDAISTFFTY